MRTANFVEMEQQLRDRPARNCAWTGRTCISCHDVHYPDVEVDSRDPWLTDDDGTRRRDSDVMSSVATRNREVSRAAVGLMTLSTTVAEIQNPWLLAALRRGFEIPAPTEPPLRPEELAVLPTRTYAAAETPAPTALPATTGRRAGRTTASPQPPSSGRPYCGVAAA